ncbi:hypothetical protein MAPG_09924 [Magnaporthiopsis poae ATCC 64411]|uniref:Uncharacterized protein n=1 Tax=Magnaporthiopsis poae (strain ATCC 64411 / 73-15) TaxID=644358 RepID=A0A0C4EB77_MAGP6|nr:hypothetical protein MAPG_09924 [Magnaporthiopsis poae ATCC 64411]
MPGATVMASRGDARRAVPTSSRGDYHVGNIGDGNVRTHLARDGDDDSHAGELSYKKGVTKKLPLLLLLPIRTKQSPSTRTKHHQQLQIAVAPTLPPSAGQTYGVRLDQIFQT